MTEKKEIKIKQPHKRPAPTLPDQSYIDRSIDKTARLFGTWQMFGLHIVFFTLWIWQDWEVEVLTLLVSLEAILLSLLLLMSQNRQSEFDRMNARADFEVDRHAEKQTRVLIEMIREIGKKVGVDEFAVKNKQDAKDS